MADRKPQKFFRNPRHRVMDLKEIANNTPNSNQFDVVKEELKEKEVNEK